MSALCHELLTWPIDASRGGVARWKGWERWLSARVTVERGVVGFGLEYACAHIIILAEISSENLLPIRADFVTERDKRDLAEPRLLNPRQLRAREKACCIAYTPLVPRCRNSCMTNQIAGFNGIKFAVSITKDYEYAKSERNYPTSPYSIRNLSRGSTGAYGPRTCSTTLER